MLNDLCFNTPIAVSQKHDGTNVGKSDGGKMYGRNQQISSKAESYQLTSIDCVKKVNVQEIKEDLLNITGIEAAAIGKFNVYGELMCHRPVTHKDIQTGESVDGTYQLFGAMIKPAAGHACEEITELLGQAGFACTIKGNEESD